MANVIPATPVPTSVDISDGDNHIHSSLKYGSATPGTMAKTVNVVTPLALFQRGSSKWSNGNVFSSFESSGETSDSESVADRIGISRPVYLSDDDMSKHSVASFRIGITRGSYDLPEGDIPISPLNLYLDKKASSPTPNLVDIDDEDGDDPMFTWSFDGRCQAPSLDQDGHYDDRGDDDSVDRTIHQQTADGHYLLSSTPLTSPNEALRYSLTEGKKGMPPSMRRASESHINTPRSGMPNRASLPTGDLGLDPCFKIFLLLLNPRSKIFELIQVLYAPSVTTIGDIISMIPANSTEPALGSQRYIGLCRPKDGSEMTDLSLMASGSHCKVSCARIMRGEILLGIPAGFNGDQCAKLSIPLLANPRIEKLLKRSDPLAAKRKKKKTRSRSSRNCVSTVETVKEESEDEQSLDEIEVARAMKNAVEAAAQANAGLEPVVMHERAPSPIEKWTSPVDVDQTASSTIAHSEAPVDSSFTTDTMSCSYQSGVHSTFTLQSGSKKIPRRTTRRRHRRSKRNTYMMRMAMAAVVFMVFRFNTDPEAEHEQDAMDDVMGLLGLIQSLVLLLSLIKWQRLCETDGMSSHAWSFMRTTEAVMDRMKQRVTNVQKLEAFA